MFSENKQDVSIEGNLMLQDQRYVVEKFTIQVDSIKGYGQIEVARAFPSVVPDINILLNLERIDLDTFFPAVHKQPEKVIATGSEIQKKKSSFSWNDDPISFSALKSANVHTNLSIGEVHYQELKLRDIIVNTHLVHGRLGLEFKAKIGDGNIAGKTAIDAVGSKPMLKQQLLCDNIAISDLPKKWTQDNKLSGVINVSANVNASGNSQRDWIKSLEGKGDVKVTQGKLWGVDLKNMARNVTAAFRMTGWKNDISTDFEQLQASFSAHQGIVHNEDFEMKVGGMRFLGVGDLNLPELVVDYRLTSHLDATTMNEGATNITVPIQIKGSLLAPQFFPDLTEPVLNFIKDPKGAQQLIETLKDNLEDAPKGIKKDLKQELEGIIFNPMKK